MARGATYDQSELKLMSIMFYRDLYTDDSMHESLPINSHWKLNNNALEEILNSIVHGEVRMAVFDMDLNKCPGFDAFLAAFYQKYYSSVGAGIVSFLQQAYIIGNFLPIWIILWFLSFLM